MRALIFDFDGLMIDSERLVAELVIDAVAELGVTLTFADIGHLFGMTSAADPLWDDLLHERLGRRGVLPELEARITPAFRARVVELPLLPGVQDLLDAARRLGLRVGLATGHDRPRLEQVLAALGVRDRFDAIVTTDEVGRGKPAPDVLFETAARLGVDPPDCLVLEDSIAGCHAAIAAGMPVVACPSVVTAHLTFPDAARRVACLTDVVLDG